MNNKRVLQNIEMILIAITIVVYSSIYFNNTFPYSDGWFINYVELVKRGMFPYKDFYYYLPPLNLLVDSIFWKLSFGYLLAYRAWYVLERILIYLLIFKLLSRFFDDKKACLACAFSAILCTADDFDFFGDYNQNVALLAVIITLLAVNFVNSPQKTKKMQNLFSAGIVLGLMFLTKQTIFVACTMVFLFLLIFICAVENDKNCVKYIANTLIGVMIPIAICIIILQLNDALVPCIEQLFLSVEGKGSAKDILIGYFLKTLHIKRIWEIALLIFLIYGWTQELHWRNVCIAALIGDYALQIGDNIDLIWKVFDDYTILSFIGLCPLAVIALIYIFKRQYYKHIYVVYALAYAMIVACGVTIIVPSIYHYVYDLGLYSKFATYFATTFFYFDLILFVVLLIYKVKKQCIFEHQNEILMIAGGGLALNYATTMAAGLDTMASNSMRISLPLALVIIFSACRSKNVISRLLKYVVAFFCVVVIMSCIAQKSIKAYPWWGMKDYPKEEKVYAIDNIPALKGILFSAEDKNMYENITKLISENSNENDIILGYPYIKIYNILCDRYNTYFVPVFWYDVVGDKYVDILIDEIKEKLPNIVVWYDIPYALETHEAIYRNGKELEQRKIVQIFDEILDKKYLLLGEYNDFYVYKLKE